MVDLSKYPKIYEWDETYGQRCSIHSINQCAVYVLRIGESLYVGESNFCRREILKHVMDMRLGIHVNPKMNEAYKKAKKLSGLYTTVHTVVRPCCKYKKQLH